MSRTFCFSGLLATLKDRLVPLSPDVIREGCKRLGAGDFLLVMSIANFIGKRYKRNERDAILHVLGFWLVSDATSDQPSVADLKIASSVWSELTSRISEEARARLESPERSSVVGTLLEILGKPAD